MKNKTIYIILLVAVSFFTSCSDWLDVQPQNQQREKDLYTTYKGYQDALTGCYAAMAARGVYGDHLTMTSIENLACLWAQPRLDNQPAQYYLNMHDYTNDYTKNIFSTIFGGLYNVIVQANAIINNLDEDPGSIHSEKGFNIVKGEALAIRAYCHFDVLRLFGQMPAGAQKRVSLPYSETHSIKIMPAYYSYEQFVDKLLKDLNEAEALLRESDPVVDNGIRIASNQDEFLSFRHLRLNYWAVRALKARLYLYTGDTSKAYQEAKAVVEARTSDGNSVISLSGLVDIPSRYNALPNECLFCLNNPNLLDYSMGLLGGYATDNYNDLSSMHLTTTMLTQLYQGQNTTSNNRYLNLWETSSRNSLGTTYPTTKKYYYDSSTFLILTELRTCLQILPMIRLSELYLMMMETTTDLAEANRLYKSYMVSHNVNVTEDFTSLDVFRAELEGEYRREFIAEGVMFYVYKRTGKSSILWNTSTMGEDQYILPLPETEYDPNLN